MGLLSHIVIKAMEYLSTRVEASGKLILQIQILWSIQMATELAFMNNKTINEAFSRSQRFNGIDDVIVKLDLYNA